MKSQFARSFCDGGSSQRINNLVSIEPKFDVLVTAVTRRLGNSGLMIGVACKGMEEHAQS
jgi:hypothetical protein